MPTQLYQARRLTRGLNNYVSKSGPDNELNYPVVQPNETGFDPKGQAYRNSIRGHAVRDLAVEEKIFKMFGKHAAAWLG
ncbi:hypothetical protein SPI_02580 [Niveomyces insectorum RCEF 264]|uniref:Uncharacterized protein n=1 Tax=Niveomyces insectorum RCEF 264 TaxID=1081102 RepID=A0A167Y3N5_9HYPO|nr:hypothetical protein SPI_02580 [Niveomyces insectorum RCEF 264]